MADKKRYIKWAIDWATGILKATFTMTTGSEKIENFDTKVIFPMWESFNEVQKHCIVTGLKPKLEDTTAADAVKALTALERWTFVTRQWKQLTEEKIWSKKAATGERMTIGKLSAEIAKLPDEKKAEIPEELKAVLRASGVVI